MQSPISIPTRSGRVIQVTMGRKTATPVSTRARPVSFGRWIIYIESVLTRVAEDFRPVLPKLMERTIAAFESNFADRLREAWLAALAATWVRRFSPCALRPHRAWLIWCIRRAEANNELPIRELMWGMPGSMLAAIHMAEMTQETRWRGLFEMQAARLLAELEDTPQGPLWTQDLYGEQRPLARARSRFRRQCHPVIARVGLVDAAAASAGGRVCAEDTRSECVAV